MKYGGNIVWGVGQPINRIGSKSVLLLRTVRLLLLLNLYAHKIQSSCRVNTALYLHVRRRMSSKGL
jgi:hypothetical protein